MSGKLVSFFARVCLAAASLVAGSAYAVTEGGRIPILLYHTADQAGCSYHDNGLVALKKGDEEALLSVENKLFKQPIISTKVVDTLGAGDSFIAGFLSSYLLEKNIAKALHNGAKILRVHDVRETVAAVKTVAAISGVINR